MKIIGFITFDKTPYRILQLNEFAKVFNINSYYTAVKSKNRMWNLPQPNFNEFMISGFIRTGKRYLIGKGIKKIVKENDHIIIGGYDSVINFQIAVACLMLGKPYSIMIDGLSPGRKSMRKGLKFYLKKWIIDNSHSIFANGSIARDYFIDEFSYDKKRIFNQYLSVDNDAIAKSEFFILEKAIVNKINDNKKNIIYSGRLLPGKNVEMIIDAISLLENSGEYRLLILGDGPEREKLLIKGKELGVDVIVLGFIENQIELFAYYYYGDMLILPSLDDAWGLVVNEAMAAGLPVLVSNMAGSYMDLVAHGENGYRFSPTNVSELSNYIKNTYHKGVQLMGGVSKIMISEWTFESSRKNFEKMIKGCKLSD